MPLTDLYYLHFPGGQAYEVTLTMGGCAKVHLAAQAGARGSPGHGLPQERQGRVNVEGSALSGGLAV